MRYQNARCQGWMDRLRNEVGMETYEADFGMFLFQNRISFGYIYRIICFVILKLLHPFDSNFICQQEL